MFASSKKPFTAVSVNIEQYTSESYEEDDLAGVPDLIEVVKLLPNGPTETARALRKKLKYGSVHRQLRALTILDGLLQNGGQRIQRTLLSDGPLLERLRIAAVDPVSDPDVRQKCKDLFSQWVASSRDNPGLDGAKSLYNQLPKSKNKQPLNQQQRREQSRVLRETEQNIFADEADSPDESRSRSNSLAQRFGGGESASSPNTLRKQSSPVPLGPSSTFGTDVRASLKKASKKDKKSKSGKGVFNLEKEKTTMLATIASSSVASTNLNNALKLVNRESHRVSDDAEVAKRFETCKSLRRQILRYIHYVESDEFLGGLIHANEELVGALMAFEVLDKSVDDDSDSELEEGRHLSRQAMRAEASGARDAEKMVAGLSLQEKESRASPSPMKPARPGKVPMPERPRWNEKEKQRNNDDSDGSDTEVDDEDSDDPFGDRNAAKTPDPEAFMKGTKGGERKGYPFIKEV